jgi:hypothetical protein
VFVTPSGYGTTKGGVDGAVTCSADRSAIGTADVRQNTTAHADERMSGAGTSLGPGQAPFRLDRRDGLAERSRDQAPNLPPFSRFHKIRIAPFRPDHGVGECVDGLGRVRDHPLLVIRRQAIAEANAQIVEQFDDIHRLMVARLDA